MSRRRRPGAGRYALTALAYLFVIPTVVASLQQEQQPVPKHQRSRPEDGQAVQPDRHASPPFIGLRQKGDIDPSVYKRFKETSIDSYQPSAIATLAPAADAAVRAPHPAKQQASSAGLDSLHHARRLQDWEVEDFVLLATVDGSIQARDRNTGAQRWALEVDNPMVETIYHRHNKSDSGDWRPEDDLLWIIEPSRDGKIYIYDQAPGGGLQRVDLTVKQLADELSPYSQDSALVYTAERKTTLFTVDSSNGRITRMFSSRGSTLNEDSVCRPVKGLEGQTSRECGSGGSLVLGRTEYTVGIQFQDTGEPVCTLVYSEWGPNKRDSDLHQQYIQSMDQKYVYSRHDSNIFGFDHAKINERRKSYTQKLDSPLVRVFDVARPLDSSESTGRETPLVILPQPTGPIDSDSVYDSQNYRNRVFVNYTTAGGWYALSESSYPFVTGDASTAKCYSDDWLEEGYYFHDLPWTKRKEALVGVHSLSDRVADGNRPLYISAPSKQEPVPEPPERTEPQPTPASSNFVLKNSKIIRSASNNALDAVIGLLLLLAFTFVGVNWKDFVKIVRHNFELKRVYPQIDQMITSPPTSPVVTEAPKLSFDMRDQLDGSNSEKDDDSQSLAPISRRNTLGSEADSRSRSSTLSEVRGRDKAGPRVRIIEPSPAPAPSDAGDETATETNAPKKKARRGCRGGSRHKKKKKDSNQSIDETKDQDENDAVQQAVEEALHIAEDKPLLEPAVEAVNEGASTVATDVSGPVIQIGHLKVYTDEVLGFGSHGTMVYKGSFGGRDVAVKRMLQEFYDIASHEVGLLQESDDHPNVIRYYDKESAGDFLYIALELCPASLQDVVEKPPESFDIPGFLGLDPPDALKQITSGLRYLHSLKIVHRDIKPQNILVSAPKKLPANPQAYQPPRLLISDFGLCKKLEGDQSSFRATTAQAAGTSGWRAPELLVDDDSDSPLSNSYSMNSTQPSSHSASEQGVLDTQSNRRATRAIDIFSLGCVFYYVLTGGQHPFDSQGKYMREANIVKGHYCLDELARLGDVQWEARDLVASMLHLDPRQRPDAARVLAHPFFWTAQARLDFLCHVSDQFEFEPRDPPSEALAALEARAPQLLEHCGGDFLRPLPPAFKDTLGKQRKYVGSRFLDLLRALRNKKNHYEDMPDAVKEKVGKLPDGYLGFWTRKFPGLVMTCHEVVEELGWATKDRFAPYYNV